MTRIGKCWWLSVFAFAGISCGIPKTHYYVMELPHAAQGPATPVARHLAVQRIRTDRVLLDDRILYRVGPNEVNYYEYHRWTSPPPDIVTSYFLHRLKDGKFYTRVTAYNEGAGSDLTLRGTLQRFEEVDREKEVLAAVALELELVDTKSRALLWRGESECTRPVASRDMAGVVRGVQECLEETATKLINSMLAQSAASR